MMNRYRVEKALSAATETAAMRIGADALSEAGKLFKDYFPEQRAVIIADRNTYAAAGDKVREILQNEDVRQEEPVVFDPKGLYAEYGFTEKLDGILSATDAVPIAVGSGTINDLVKLSAHHAGRSYMCVATAASMDGYTAYGASITLDGAKQTFQCPAPLVVVADTDVIAAAPSELTAAGYADLSAKIVAGADWLIADALGVEALQPDVFAIVQEGLEDALGDPAGVVSGVPGSMGALVEGLMLGGFAMQASHTSRPASGADHQFSHLWDMQHHTFNGETPSHGFKVSIGTLASAALYEMFLSEDIPGLDIEKAVAVWPTLDEAKRKALEMFEGTDFPELGAVETEAKYIDHEGLRLQLVKLKANWPQIREKLRGQVVPFDTLKERLSKAGAPTHPSEIGLSGAMMRDSFLRAQHLRRRFTILDIAVRLGKLDEWLDTIFAEGGLWPENPAVR